MLNKDCIMDMTNEKVIEKKVYEDDNRKHDYASKGVAGTALGLGIAGTALGVLPWLTGNGGRSIFGSLGNGMPDNVNINTYGGMTTNNAAPTALEVMEKECADEVKLLTDMFGLKLDTANKFYAMRETDVAEKFSIWKGFVEAQNAENRRAMEAEFGLYKSQRDGNDKLKDAMVQQGFGLYKSQRDGFDALNEKYAAKFNELDKKVAVMEAIRPYQDKLLMDYTDKKTCKCIYGQLVLPSTPTVTGYGSYQGCNCVSSGTPAGA